jgi:hypothetical protein
MGRRRPGAAIWEARQEPKMAADWGPFPGCRPTSYGDFERLSHVAATFTFRSVQDARTDAQIDARIGAQISV